MKKLILFALLIAATTLSAQEKSKFSRKEKTEQMSTDQRNQLRLKKMTLYLDLNADQQKEMGKIIAEMDAKKEALKTQYKAKKEAGVKPDADEKFAIKNKILDEQIVQKQRVKKILNPDQFEKWEKMKNDRRNKLKVKTTENKKM